MGGLRICFLAHLSSVRTRRLAAALRDAGHAIDVASLTPGLPIDGVGTHVLQRRWPVSYERTNWHYLAALPRLRSLLRRLRPDLVYAQFVSSYGVLGTMACPASWPFVLAVQGDDLLTIARRSAVHRAASRFALRRADLVLSPAPHLTDEVRRLCASAPILTRQYGVDTSRFRPPAEGAAARLPLVLSARALVPRKGIEVVLEAARQLQRTGSPLTVELADDGERRAALEREYRDLVAAGRARFVGTLTEEALAGRLRTAAVYVSMAETDGTSMTLMEAMACGAFPVVADIPANRHWIEQGRTGFLVPCGASSELAGRWEDAWTGLDLRDQAAAANVALIGSRMDSRRNIAEIEAALRDVVEVRRRTTTITRRAN